MPPSAPLSLLSVCTELRAQPIQRFMLLKQDLGELLSPAAEIQKTFLWLPSSRPARPSCYMITVSASKPTAFSLDYTLAVWTLLLCSDWQHQDAENRHAEPNYCGDWLPSSVQMEVLSFQTWSVETKASPCASHLSYNNPELREPKGTGRCWFPTQFPPVWDVSKPPSSFSLSD